MLACLAAAAPTAAADPLSASAPTRFQLANGLDVVLEENHRSPEVAVVVAYEVGSRDDPAGYAGLAHLVEHMTYGGSKHLKGNQAITELNRLGLLEFQGRTTRDITIYSEALAREGLPTALWVESERMAFTLEQFDQTTLDREKRRVGSENRLHSGPSGEIDRYAFEAMFGPDHPYVRSDQDTSVSRMTLDDVQWFFQKYYCPRNAHLIIVGDFDTAGARDLVKKYFGPVANPPPSRGRPSLEPLADFRFHSVIIEYPNLARETLRMIWPVPRTRARERAALEIFAASFNKRLRQRLIGRRGLAARLNTTVSQLDGVSTLTVNVDLMPDVERGRLEDEVGEEWRATWAGDWPRIVAATQPQRRLSLLADLESPNAMAMAQLSSIRSDARPFSRTQDLADHGSVTAADVLRWQRTLDEHRWLVIRVVRAAPEDDVPRTGRVTLE